MKNFQSGRYIQQGHYKSFQPDPINRKWSVDNMELIQLLGKADRELGRLDMYSEYIPNIDLFISMHVLKEATQSSKIEGTQTNIAEALLDEEDVAPEKRDDWEEVQNYVAATKEAIIKLQTLRFSARPIRETHRTLLQGVRGKHKQPGEFRQSQNWIGGATLSDAIFVPPVHNSIGELMSDIERFVHNNTDYFPELLKIALVHYQFETIHPFLDGNGRVGRLLIPLYLVVGGAYPTDNRGILKQPVLYLSDFFERNRTNYYDNLMRVREKNDLLQWFKFFLVGIIETASSSVATFDNILKLQKQVEGQIQTLGSRTVNAQKVINYLYQRPIIDAAKVAEVVAVSSASAYKLIVDLVQLGVLEEITGGKRGKLYIFTAYLNLFK
jgi:Fic family protein